jgi:glycosyltransferase involved in cell wall biosynthesis
MHSNYQEKKIPFPLAWMQTRFAWALFWDTPEKLFLPIQAAPFLLPRSIEVTATIHDLAWKKYPETFTRKDRFKLNILLGRVLRRADKLIAVSDATKRDILEYFPEIQKEKIQVIHHGFDSQFFSYRLTETDREAILSTYKLEAESYILYVGALQPRKNLVRLIQAFEAMKAQVPEAKLVLAGEVAWLADDILEAREKSIYRGDIILTGKVSFDHLRALYQGSRVFAFPSLYEGFGMPVLEAFASGIPVLVADNSSLPEVAGTGALYCNALSVEDIAEKLSTIWHEENLRTSLIAQGQKELGRFSWERSAKETLEYILETH